MSVRESDAKQAAQESLGRLKARHADLDAEYRGAAGERDTLQGHVNALRDQTHQLEARFKEIDEVCVTQRRDINDRNTEASPAPRRPRHSVTHGCVGAVAVAASFGSAVQCTGSHGALAA